MEKYKRLRVVTGSRPQAILAIAVVTKRTEVLKTVFENDGLVLAMDWFERFTSFSQTAEPKEI